MNAAHKYDILNDDAYDISISRNDAEEARSDHFGLRSNVKGLANMNHQKSLSAYAEELVSHYAKYASDQYTLSLDYLPESERNELARLYMEATDRETSECVYGNDFSINNDFTCALLSMLKDDSQESRERFARVTRKNIIIYYETSLQETLNDACNTYLHRMMDEQGYYAHRDIEHDEIHWSKF